MYHYNDRISNNGPGHVASGGGATIKDSPVIINPVTIHVHVYSGDSELFINKIMRSLNAAIGKRTLVLEQATELPEAELQGSIHRELVSR